MDKNSNAMFCCNANMIYGTMFFTKIVNQISVTRLDVVTTLDYFTSAVFGKLSKPIMMR